MSDGSTPAELPPDLDGNSDKYVCDDCGASLGTRAGLWKHRTRKHSPVAQVAEVVSGDKRPAQSQGTPASKPTTPARRERKPTVPTGKRVPLDDKLGMVWGVAGSMLMPAVSPLAARAMVLQAPAAGPVLDELIAGTPIDKVAQRFAGKGKKAGNVGALIGLPVLMFLIERNPVLVMNPVVDGLLTATIQANLISIIDAQYQAKKRAEELEAKAKEAGINLVEETADGQTVTLVDKIKADLLAPLFTPATEEGQAS